MASCESEILLNIKGCKQADIRNHEKRINPSLAQGLFKISGPGGYFRKVKCMQSCNISQYNGGAEDYLGASGVVKMLYKEPFK